MLHIKKEGLAPKQGLNFYHPRDTGSAGVFLRVGNHVWSLRWSKKIKKLFKSHDVLDPTAFKQFESTDI